MTVFLQVPLAALLTTPAVARVLIGALLKAVIVADGKGDQKRVLFLLDEAARLGRMKVLETARDAGRKYGITLQLQYQSTGQLEEQWGRAGSRLPQHRLDRIRPDLLPMLRKASGRDHRANRRWHTRGWISQCGTRQRSCSGAATSDVRLDGFRSERIYTEVCTAVIWHHDGKR